MSEAITRGVKVEVESFFVAQRSRTDEGYYFFAYRVEISNVGSDVVQLVSRHWIITDGDCKVDEVRGPGVVGETPVLSPGETFRYTSACPLPTPVGTMHGTFQMVDAQGEPFDAVVAPFTLAVPNALN